MTSRNETPRADAPTRDREEPVELDEERARPRAEKSSLLRWLHPEGVDWGANVGDYDPSSIEGVRRWLAPFFDEGGAFAVTVQGWENLAPAPAMIVSNHSGGTLFLDAWGLLYAWYGEFGGDRPIHPAAHEIILGNRITGPFFAKRGVIRADQRVARRVLTRWNQDLLVMPGGDLDVWRPYTKRYAVQFAGRKGYARLALESQVPVVPLANAGAQETFVVLTDGHRIAKALRLPQLVRANIWPIHLSLPWGIGFGPLPHLPVPTRLRYRFGPAVHPEEFAPRAGQPVTEAQVEAFDAAVRAGVQAQLDRLREER